MKTLSYLLSQGVTPRQIRRGHIPKRFRRGLVSGKELKEAQIILMNVVVHVPILVWDMPKSLQGKSDKGWKLHSGIVNPEYTTFFTPQPTHPDPAEFSDLLKDYDKEIKNVKEKTSTPEDRDASWEAAYITGVKPTLMYAQNICLMHPEWAAQIAAALGLRLKEYTSTDKDDLSVKQVKDGSVELSGTPKKQRCLFQWQGTKDPTGVLGWKELDIPPSFECKTQVDGLSEGKWFFRVRKIYRKHKVGEWCQPVSFMVKNS